MLTEKEHEKQPKLTHGLCKDKIQNHKMISTSQKEKVY